MQALPILQTLLLLLLLLAGVVLLTEATKESGSSANTTLQAQPGKHHVSKVSHTEGWDQSATQTLTARTHQLAACPVNQESLQ